MERAYEIRIYPNASQRALIERTFGCCRWVYNRCLETKKAEYERTGNSPTVYRLQKLVTAWKREEAPWLSEVDSHALQQAVVNLGRAFDGFFRRCKLGGRPGYPRFKSKRDNRQSYRTNWGIAVQDVGHVKLPKLGTVKARVSRVPEGRVVNATVKRTPTGKYFVTVCCADCPAPDMPEGSVEVMGIDAGIHYLAARSDGQVVANSKSLAKSQKRLAREQRRLSRKRKGSNRRSKQRVRVARVHEKIANQRKDAIHKATTSAVRESQAIAVEDLNVEGMRRNRHLAKAVSDASMSEMIRQLAYKCAWYGRAFVKVGRFFPSSRTCSACGHMNPGVVLGVEKWTCPVCGAEHDRDFNAAVNIAREGARLLAEGNGTAGLAGTGGAQGPRTLVEQA